MLRICFSLSLVLTITLGSPVGESLIEELREEVRQLHQAVDEVGEGKASSKREYVELKELGMPDPELQVRTFDNCPAGFVYIKETRGCYRLIYDTETWSDAYAACRDLDVGAGLVTFNTATEEYFVHDLIHTYSASSCAGFWTSGIRVSENRDYIWIWYNGGFDHDYGHWAPKKPSNNANNHNMCLEMNVPKLLWYDTNCNTKRCYICETSCRT